MQQAVQQIIGFEFITKVEISCTPTLNHWVVITRNDSRTVNGQLKTYIDRIPFQIVATLKSRPLLRWHFFPHRWRPGFSFFCSVASFNLLENLNTEGFRRRRWRWCTWAGQWLEHFFFSSTETFFCFWNFFLLFFHFWCDEIGTSFSNVHRSISISSASSYVCSFHNFLAIYL